MSGTLVENQLHAKHDHRRGDDVAGSDAGGRGTGVTIGGSVGRVMGSG